MSTASAITMTVLSVNGSNRSTQDAALTPVCLGSLRYFVFAIVSATEIFVSMFEKDDFF